MYSQLSSVIQALYQTDQEVGKLELVSPEELMEVLGTNYIKQHLNFLADLLVILAFVVTMCKEPRSYTHNDYLDMREAHLMDFRNVLLDKIRSSTRSRGSNRVPRLSPNGRFFGPRGTQSHVSPQWSQVRPDVTNVSSRRSSNSHPNFIAHNGSDVEEELSESASQAAAREQVEEMEAEAFYQDQADQGWYRRTKRDGNSSVKSYQGTVRSMRKEEYKRKESPPKTRSNVSSDKIQWDGKRSTYPAFQADMEGTLLRLGMGYLVDRDVMDAYAKEGLDYIKSDPFWAEFGISIKQFKYDIKYLFGFLRSSTKKIDNPYIMQHNHDKDGLLVWIKFEKAYAFGGSRFMRSEELEDKLLTRYNPREYSGVADYIDKFQSWVEQLDALGTREYNDSSKKRILLRNLKTDHNLLTLIQICKDDEDRDFNDTADYLRENGTSMDRALKKITTRSSKMLNTTKEPSDDLSMEQVCNMVEQMTMEMPFSRVYSTLNSPIMRSSLHIPNDIWQELEPQMKEKMLEIKKRIKKKKQEAGGEKTKSTILPPQYPSRAAQVAKFNAMLANACADDDVRDSDGSTDDDVMKNVFHTYQMDSSDDSDSSEHSDLEVKANLETVINYSHASSYFAISDGGADSCVLGTHAEVISHTGRYATLVGYDPKTTKSKRIPIVTAFLKVRAHNGIPVLLKINEAVYNEGCPVTLLSEYQIREHGFVIDSVATKHLKAPGIHGQQRLVLNEDVHIPFQDRGGINGF